MSDYSKVLCAIDLLRPQSLNMKKLTFVSLRRPNALFLAQTWTVVTVLRMSKWREDH